MASDLVQYLVVYDAIIKAFNPLVDMSRKVYFFDNSSNEFINLNGSPLKIEEKKIAGENLILLVMISKYYKF